MSYEPEIKPVAVAEIRLSDDERKRIAADLGLAEDQLEAVPRTLEIARYAQSDIGDDVAGFVQRQLAVGEEREIEPGAITKVGSEDFAFTRIPEAILIAQ